MAGQTIIDSRGRAHEVAGAGWGMRGDPLDPRDEAGATLARLGCAAALLMVGAVIAFLILSIVLGSLIGSEGALLAAGVVMVLIGVVGHRVLGREYGRERSRQLTDAAALHKRCACCDYELAGLPPEQDGCVVCPECSAAWRLGVAAAGATTPSGRTPPV